MENVDDDAIRSRLADHGIAVSSLERVSVTLDGSEATYGLETVDGERLFVQTVSAEQAEAIRSILDRAEELAVPHRAVIDGEPPLAVMTAASGRPLSRVLPVALLPLVWRRRGDDLASALRHLGTALGRLHAAGPEAVVTVDEVRAFESELAVDEALSATYDDATLDRIREVIAALRTTRTVETLVHTDPTPHNIYYDDGSVQLIDVGFQRGPAVKDVLVAEQAIELSVRRLPWGRSTQRDRLMGAFRSGYDRTGVAIDRDADSYAAFEVATYTALLARYLGGERKTWRARVSSGLDTPILRDLVLDRLARIDDRR